MNTKNFVLVTSIVALVAMSGHAHAGTTISDKRYWPSEVNTADQTTVQHPENAFALARTPEGIEATGPRYQGGPKENQ